MQWSWSTPTSTRRTTAAGFGGMLAGWLVAFLFDRRQGRRRRRQLLDRSGGIVRRRTQAMRRLRRGASSAAYGSVMRAMHRRERRKAQPDDATLAQKVESEAFRPADVPKGKINVNAEGGVVYLRGEVEPELIERIVKRTREVQGVRAVRSLLHRPGTPAPMKR